MLWTGALQTPARLSTATCQPQLPPLPAQLLPFTRSALSLGCPPPAIASQAAQAFEDDALCFCSATYSIMQCPRLFCCAGCGPCSGERARDRDE